VEDTRFFRVERRRKDCEEEFTELSDSAIKWLLKFSVGRCEVIHMVKNNSRVVCEIEPAVTTQEHNSKIMIFSFIKH